MNFDEMNVKEFGIAGRVALLLVFFVALVAVTPASLPAQEQADEDSEWRYSVTVYGWLLALDGDVTVKGIKSDLDVSFSEIWDELNIAGFTEFEAWKGRFGLFVNGFYADLGHSTKVSGVRLDPDLQVFWGSTGALCRLGTWDLTDEPGKYSPTVTLDTYLGVRYSWLDVKLDFKDALLPDPSGKEDWFEPILGLRTIWDLSDRWSLSLAGDIGGMAFGSDFAWGAYGVFGYRFNLFGNDNARVIMGYRALSQDYDDGHGSNKFEWDVTIHGPVIGLTIPF